MHLCRTKLKVTGSFCNKIKCKSIKIASLTFQNIFFKTFFAFYNYHNCFNPLPGNTVSTDQRNKMRNFGRELNRFEVSARNKRILKLEKSLMTSKDLDQSFDLDINEIHIICNTLSLDKNLPTIYRGKNIFIVADQINIQDSIVWDISGVNSLKTFGTDASKNEFGVGNNGNDGEPGQDGGNLEIVCDSIYEYSNWKIISNGGNGSNGQNGGNGADGSNGNTVSRKQFQISGEQITCFNFCHLLNNIGMSTNIGSWHKTYYKDGFQKQIFFNQDETKSEMIMLVFGSKGMPGQLGGLGGAGGRGGKPGIINKNLQFSAVNGNNGKNGSNGFNGKCGQHGNNAYLTVRSTDKEPFYGGLDEPMHLQIAISNIPELNSIYYPPWQKYLHIVESSHAEENVEPSLSSINDRLEKLENHKIGFLESLKDVLKYSNENEKLEMNKILSNSVDFSNFLKYILENSIDIKEYDSLSYHAKCLAGHAIIMTKKTSEILSKFSSPLQFTSASNGTYTIKGYILTTKDIEKVDGQFLELKVVCEVFHINSCLSDKFRGKNLSIHANNIIIYTHTELNLSGHDQLSEQQKSTGNHNTEGENGGNCFIECRKIENQSLLYINTSGGRGSNGQLAGNGNCIITGASPKIEDFKINGRPISANLLRSINKIKTFIDDGFQKTIYVQSDTNYLMLIKGLKGTVRLAKNGINKYHKCFCNNPIDGHDAVLIVKDGKKKFIDINHPFLIEICSHNIEYENSIFMNDKYYFPQRTHCMQSFYPMTEDKNFYKNLISVMRNSNNQFDSLVDVLQIQKFISNEISLLNVVNSVVNNYFDIPHFKVLQEIAKNFRFNKNSEHEPIRRSLQKFVKDLSITESKKVITIRKKILRVSEIMARNFDPNIVDFHIISDTLYVDSSLTYFYRGRNLKISCTFLKVTNKFEWDLSGNSATQFQSDAGQDDDGRGNHGDDGKAGESGGNCLIQCKFIDNGCQLTIISNGGNGADGQNGGNGRDGAEGKSAKLSDFFVGDIEIKSPIKDFNKFKNSKNVRTMYEKSDARYVYYYRAEFKSNNNLKGYFYRTLRMCKVLVKGDDGEPGKLGGIGGYGGNPGYPGKISIKCKNPKDNSIITKRKFGEFGKNGFNGHNGLQGRPGGDIFKFDYQWWKRPKLFGHDRFIKFKTIKLNDLGGYVGHNLTFGANQFMEIKLYSQEDGDYFRIVEDNEYVLPSTEKYRNYTIQSRLKKSHAYAHKSGMIHEEAIKKEHLNEILDIDIDQKELKNFQIRQIRYDKERNVEKLNCRFQYQKSVDIAAKDPFAFIKSSKLNLDQCLFIINKINERFSDGQFGNAIDSKSDYDSTKGNKVILDFDALLLEEIQSNTSNECNKRLEELKKLCEEKYLSLVYKDFYNYCKDHAHSQQETEQISFSSAVFRDQFPFLNDSKAFNSSSDILNNHFNGNSEHNTAEILEYLENSLENIQSSLPESIFNYLLRTRSLHQKISTFLFSFFEKVKLFEKVEEDSNTTIIDITDEQTELIEKSTRKDEFKNILKSFFETEEIIDYIKDELQTKGIKSPLYREILAHKYNFKFVVCRQALNDDEIKVFEWHNFGNDLKFKYQKRSKVDSGSTISKLTSRVKSIKLFKNLFNSPKTINEEEKKAEEIIIFMNNQQFTILNLNKQKYENYVRKEETNKNLKKVASTLEYFQETSDKLWETSFKQKEVQQSLIKIDEKLNLVENSFSRIFQTEDNDEDDLNSMAGQLSTEVISILLKNYYSVDVKNQNLLEISDLTSFDSMCKKYGLLRIVSEIECIFRHISSIGGLAVLKALKIQLNNNEHLYSLEDFLILIKSIFIMLYNKEIFVVSTTFMIIGYEPELWLPELIMTKINCIFGILDENMWQKWKQKLIANNNMTTTLAVFLDRIKYFEMSKEYVIPTIQEFDQIFDNLDYLDDESIENLKDTNMKLWGTITTDKYWNINLKKLNLLQDNISDDIKLILEDMSCKYGVKTRKLMEVFIEKKNEISDINLKEFASNFKNGKWLFGDTVLTILKTHPVRNWICELNQIFNSASDIRNKQSISYLIREDNETSDGIKTEIDNISNQFDEVMNYIKSFQELNELEILKRSKISSNVSELLALIVKVFDLKGGIKLRDTQLISILTMINSGHGVLMQISTGEGKTFIGVAFAILKALLGENVDIVTSSSVLAKRDATNVINKAIFDFFKIKVDHNCHKKADRRKRAYNCKVVYGTLCNFQHDYLSTEFYEQKIMPDHHFKNILIDEVDSMLLDKGNNILYLAQDLPDLDEVESILIFMWELINHKFDSFKEMNVNIIRKEILDHIYGILSPDNIKMMEKDVDEEKIIKILRDSNVIDRENLLNHENFDEQKLMSLLASYDEPLIEKIVRFCKNKLECKNQLKFPKHLKDFVFLHLDKWIENAIRAKYLNNTEEYVLDTSDNGNTDIKIIDLDTGTDMLNSHWDEGLHQFLQIKHGCRLSPLSLKSVFISNVSFFKKYSNLYGMTGTLGSIEERQKIIKIHNIHFATIPRYVTRKFEEYLTVTKPNERDWLESIDMDVKQILENKRSILIICKTILDTQKVNRCITKTCQKFKILLYQRDSDVFEINLLDPGYVIISTNLAGRGTDIKLSQELINQGGLHVILAYLPENSRIEEQAFGRAARSGHIGTGRLIICNPNNKSLSKLKDTRNQIELKRLDELSIYYENLIKIVEKYFEEFQSEYQKLKKNLPKKKSTFLTNFIVQWSFWLDRNSMLLEDWKNVKNSSILEKNFEKFLSEKEILHPVMMIEFYKELIGKTERSLNREEIFDACVEKVNFISQTSLEQAEKLEKDFCEDLFSHQYFKLYGMLRKRQQIECFKHRQLSKEEQLQIRKCLKMAESIVQNRQIRIEIVKYLKEKTPENMKEINGYENQQEEILQIYDEIVKSLRVLKGEDVNPLNLETLMIDKDVMKNQLYEELLELGCIDFPKVNEYYSDEDVESVCRRNNIKYSNLKAFLESIKDIMIRSMKDFEKILKENFEMPSRVEFWNFLTANGILVDETEFAVFNMIEIQNVDPSAGEFIKSKYISEAFDDISNKTVFFSLVEVNTDEKFTIKMESIKSDFSENRLAYLVENNVITVNKTADFDEEKFKSLKDSSIFGKFETKTIKLEDFEEICKNHQQIVNKLTDPNYGVLILRSDGAYNLNYENLVMLKIPQSLKEDYVYQSRIYELLQRKFAYKIAIESLGENLKNGIISLDISPHTKLLNDLINHGIIDQAKINQEQLDKYNDLWTNSKFEDTFKFMDLENNQNFFNELLLKNFVDSNKIVQNFDSNKIKLSSDYQHVESTVLLLLQNRRLLNENKDEIKNLLKSMKNPLLNNDLESIEVILVPIEIIVPRNEFLSFMDLKGLGSIIKVQQQMYR